MADPQFEGENHKILISVGRPDFFKKFGSKKIIKVSSDKTVLTCNAYFCFHAVDMLLYVSLNFIDFNGHSPRPVTTSSSEPFSSSALTWVPFPTSEDEITLFVAFSRRTAY